MDPLFDEMIDTLVQAREAVSQGIEAQLHRPISDRRWLWQLGQRVRTFAQQTDSLLLLMVERNAPVSYVKRVEHLVDFFHDAEDQIDLLLTARGTKAKARGPA